MGSCFRPIFFSVRYSVNRSYRTLLIITWHFYIRYSHFVDFYFVRDVYCGICCFFIDQIIDIFFEFMVQKATKIIN